MRNFHKAGVLVVLASLVMLVGGCATPQTYHVKWTSKEYMAGKLDAVWFLRTIGKSKTGPFINHTQAIELVYCPKMPGKPVVCRTAVVWRENQGRLQEAVDGDSSSQ